MSIKDLLTVPDAVQKAAAVIAGLDQCFVVGFGRLGPEQIQALQALGRICSGTPLKDVVGAAVEALGRNEFVENRPGQNTFEIGPGNAHRPASVATGTRR